MRAAAAAVRKEANSVYRDQNMLPKLPPITTHQTDKIKIPVGVSRSARQLSSGESGDEKSPVAIYRAVSKSLRKNIVKGSARQSMQLELASGADRNTRKVMETQISLDSSLANKSSPYAMYDDQFRERIYKRNAALKIEENERFRKFKSDREGLNVSLDYDSDESSTFETPPWMLQRCRFYNSSMDRYLRKQTATRKSKAIGDDNICETFGAVSGAV